MDNIITALLNEADRQGLQHVDIMAALIQALMDADEFYSDPASFVELLEE